MKNLMLFALIIATGVLFGQSEMPVKKELDGLKVTYAFHELKGKRAEEGPQELCLHLLNTNDYDVKVTFTLAFFKDGVMDQESAEMDLTIKPGKTLKGKKYGLCWLIDEENDQKIKENAFDWELNDLTVSKL